MTEAQCGVCKRWSEAREDGGWAGAGNRCPCCGSYVVVTSMPHRETTGEADNKLMPDTERPLAPLFQPALGVHPSEDRNPSAPPIPTDRPSIHDPVLVLLQETRELRREVQSALAIIASVAPHLDAIDSERAAHRQAFLEVKSIIMAVMLSGEGSQKGLAGKVLLMVEDEPTLRRMYRKELSAAGAAVYTARNAHEAMVRLRELGDGRLDAAYIDVHLGDESVNGVELARTLKAERPNCRIVLITGAHGPGLAAAAAALGGVALQKPVDLVGLKAALFVE